MPVTGTKVARQLPEDGNYWWEIRIDYRMSLIKLAI